MAVESSAEGNSGTNPAPTATVLPTDSERDYYQVRDALKHDAYAALMLAALVPGVRVALIETSDSVACLAGSDQFDHLGR